MAVAVILLFVWFARDVLLLAFAGVLVGVFLRRLSTWLSSRTGLSPRWSLAVVCVGLLSALVGAFAARGPSIAAEVRTLSERLPEAVTTLRERLERYEWGQRAIEAAPSPSEVARMDTGVMARATGFASRTFGALASIVIILFVGLMLAATPRVYADGLLALLPEDKVPRGREVLGQLYDTIWWWLVGRLIAMTFIGVLTGIGLWIIGVPLVFVLALLAAVLAFIPNVGPILSAIPAVLIALVQGPRQALWVIALYAGVQAVESYVLDPIIDRKTVYLPPALTILAQLVMALFTGILGVALATPLTAVFVVLVTMLYVQDMLGRRDVSLPSH